MPRRPGRAFDPAAEAALRAQQTAIETARMAALEPAVNCPRCGVRTSGPSEGRAVDGTTLMYLLEPCGCWVDETWAVCFRAEVNRRKAGQPPASVLGEAANVRSRNREAMGKRLAELAGPVRLYHAQGAGWSVERESAERECVRLANLLLGLHRTAAEAFGPIAGLPMTERTRQWARGHGLLLPNDPLPETPLPPEADLAEVTAEVGGRDVVAAELGAVLLAASAPATAAAPQAFAGRRVSVVRRPDPAPEE